MGGHTRRATGSGEGPSPTEGFAPPRPVYDATVWVVGAVGRAASTYLPSPLAFGAVAGIASPPPESDSGQLDEV